MTLLKKRWNEEYERYRFLNALRGKASRFSKEQSVLNLVLVQECSDVKTQLKVTTAEAQDTYQRAEPQEHQEVGLQHENK